MTDFVIGWLATYALHSTLLLGGAWMLTRRLPSEGWRETAWKAALLGGLVTASVQGVTTARPLAGRWSLPEAAAEAAPAPAAQDAVAAVPAEPVVLPGAVASAPSAPSTPAAAPELEPTGAEPVSLPLPLLAWLAGALLLLARVVRRHLRLAALLRGRRPVREAGALAIVAELRRSGDVRREVRLTVSALCPTPLALRGGEICVPERLLALDEAQQRSALAHEMAHVVRRDPEWQLFVSLLEAILFFQPLNRLARRALRESAEHQCDDWAVRRTASPLALARCLMEVAGWVGAERRLPRAVPAMAEPGSPLVRRVERLLAGAAPADPPSGWARLAAALSLVALTAVAAPALSAIPAPWQAEVIAHPAPGSPLAEKWGWAEREAGRRGDRDRWVAWSFDRLLPARVTIMEDSDDWSPEELGRGPLGALLLGPGYRLPAESASPSRQPLVILFHLRGGTIDRVAVRSATLGIDLRDPVYWLGETDQRQSLEWLIARSSDMATAKLEGVVVEAVAVHEGSERVVAFLESVIRGSRPTEVRAEAVEGLAWHATDRSVGLLRAVALGGDLPSIRAEAAEALGEVDAPAADAVLAEVVASSAPLDVRREAVEAMGESPAERASEALERIVEEVLEEDLQAEALETLAELSEERVAEVLERVARTHESERIREEAMESLVEADAAVAARLIQELLEDSDAALQRQLDALDVLEELAEAMALPILVRTAREHPRAEVREEAREKVEELVRGR